jgi:hypothetical protein
MNKKRSGISTSLVDSNIWRFSPWAIAVTACFVAPSVLADVTAGPPFDLVTPSQTFNGAPLAIARNSSGRSVVVWSDEPSIDYPNGTQYADIFDSNGALIAQVTLPVGGVWTSSVAMDNEGDFVVAGKGATAATAQHIQAQRFSSDGAAVGSVIDIADTATLRYQPRNPKSVSYGSSDVALAMDSDGDFVVAWTQSTTDVRVGPVSTYCSYLPTCFASYRSQNSLYVRAYSAGGQATSNVIKAYASAEVSTSWWKIGSTIGGLGAARMLTPSVAMSGSADFLVAFDVPGYTEKVYVKRYSASGNLELNKQIASFKAPAGSAEADTVAKSTTALDEDSSGSFVIGWRQPGSYISGHQLSAGSGLFAQRYSASGTAIGSPTTLFEDQNSLQASPRLALSGSGSFLATWLTEFPSGSEAPTGVGQAYAADGTPSGAQFHFGNGPDYYSDHILLAADAAGNGLSVWQGTQFVETSSGQPYTLTGIGGQFLSAQ